MLVTNSNRLSILSCCCSLVFFRLGWRRFFFITWSHFLSTLRIPNFLALSTGKEDILFAHSVNQLMCFFWSICDNDLWEVTLLIRWWIICCWDASVRLCDCVSWYWEGSSHKLRKSMARRYVSAMIDFANQWFPKDRVARLSALVPRTSIIPIPRALEENSDGTSTATSLWLVFKAYWKCHIRIPRWQYTWLGHTTLTRFYLPPLSFVTNICYLCLPLYGHNIFFLSFSTILPVYFDSSVTICHDVFYKRLILVIIENAKAIPFFIDFARRPSPSYKTYSCLLFLWSTSAFPHWNIPLPSNRTCNSLSLSRSTKISTSFIFLRANKKKVFDYLFLMN